MQLGEVKQAGKLKRMQPEAVVACINVNENHRLCVTDSRNGMDFLIDTGANVSVIPVTKVSSNKRNYECNYKLFAANGTEIKTFGVLTLELNLGLRRSFKWPFIICDVVNPIIGADFLKTHRLLVDLHNRKLVDSVTHLCTVGTIISNNEPTIKSIQETHPFRDLLEKFSDITKPVSFKETLPMHSVKHYIDTTGPPLYAKPRPLPPTR